MSEKTEGTAKRGASNTWTDRQFHLAGHGTMMRTEILAGIIIFVTITCVLGTVPGIMANAGLDRGVMLTSTILLIIVTTAATALVINRPFTLTPGLGSVATVSGMIANNGILPKIIAGAIFRGDVIFIVISYIDLRDAAVNATPASLKHAVNSGVGLFIALLGCKNAGMIIALKGKNNLALGDLNSSSVLLMLIEFLLILTTKQMRVPGYMTFSTLTTALVRIPMGFTRMPEVLSMVLNSPFGQFMKADFLRALRFAYLPFLIATFVPGFFSTLGMVLDVGTKAGFLDEDGDLPGVDKVFKAGAATTVLGSLSCMPCTTTYLESPSGMETGGRTGLTPILTSVCFVSTLPLAPPALTAPLTIAVPTLIIIGVGILSSMRNINYGGFTESLPAFICVIFTIFASNIVNEICVALPVYAALKLVSGKIKEMPRIMYVLLGVCALYFYSIIRQFIQER